MNNMENKIITDGRQKYGQADQVRPFFCKMCPWKFKCASDLRIHLFVHSGKTPTCEVCKTKFQCHIALKKHMKVHEKIRTHKKKRWSKYDISSREENGSVSSEVERKVICSFCDTAFSDIDALQEHLPTHNDLNDLENKVITEKKQQDGQADHFSCKMCPCKFLCATELRIHLFAHSGKTPTCEVCKRKFNFRNGLKKHMMVHKQVQTFKNNIFIQEENRPIPSKNKLKEIPCSFCDIVFSGIDALQDHLPSHNEINNSGTRLIIERREQQGHADKGHPVSCKICRVKFSTAIELRIHLFLHSGKIPTCEVCGRKFLLRKHLKGHMMIHEKVRHFKCKICEKEFFRGYKLRQHINMIHLGMKLKCDTCNSVFSHPKRLAEHKRWVHSSSDDMKCDKCDEQFNSFRDLSIHKLTHSKRSQFICLICNIVFARKRELTRHKSTSHRDKDKKVHQCSECYRKFKLLNNLIDHKKLHADDKTCPKFRCENCSKVFANDNHLRMHTTRCQEHAKLKLCHKCGQFCDNRSFSDHLKSHSDTGGYTCKACNEIFSNRKSFKIHVLRHKGITPPTCDRCGFECVNASALKRHIDCHNGVKAFECKECGKKYSSVTSLNEHMVKHTGIRPYQCKLCHRSFPCRKNKVRHEKLHAKGFQRIRK